MCKYLKTQRQLSWSKVTISTLPVVVVGLIKAIMLHFKYGAAEYGKHWNFFFNLALTPYTLILFNYLPSPHLVPPVSLAIMGIYQYCLSYRGLADYISSPSSTDLFSANKIGIFSAIAYCNIFIMSCYLYKAYHIPNPKKKIALLAAASTALLIAYHVSNAYFKTSRKLGNLSFYLWSLANGTVHVTVLAVVNRFYAEPRQRMIFTEIISRHRLEVFLAANCFCGLIKFFIDTKHISVIKGSLILVGYIFCSSCVGAILFFFKSRLF